MKQGKKQKYSKLLALLLAFMMVFTMMPGMAMAEEAGSSATATVYLTVSDQGALAKDNEGGVMANRPVTVTDIDSDGKFSYNEALVAAHSAYNSAEGYETSAPNTVTKLWGKESTDGFLFFTNNTGLDTGVGGNYVEDGDYLTASVNTAGEVAYTNWYTFFDSCEKSIKAGDDLTLTLKGILGMAYLPEDLTPSALSGIAVGLWENGQFKDFDTPLTTDANGQVTMSFDSTGTYYITAKGTVSDEVTDYNTPYPFETKTVDCPIIAPVCVVTVTNEAPDATVHMTVNNKGVIAETKDDSPMANCEVTVKDINKDGVLTYHEALVAAHAEYMTADAYAASESEDGLFVSKLWGMEARNTLYYKNGTALAYSVGDTSNSTVSEGDFLYASVNADNTYYADRFASFDATAKKVSMGADFELTLSVGTTETTVYDNVKVGTWVEGAFSEIEGKTFGADGKITLSFTEPGTYYVTAKGTVSDTVTDYSNWPEISTLTADCPIMAPVCIVTVPSDDLGELVFTSSSVYKDRTFDITPAFSEDVDTYTLYVPASSSSIYAWAALADDAEGKITINYNNTSGAATAIELTSEGSSGVTLSSVLAYESTTGNTLKVKVGDAEKYTINVVRIATAKTLTVKDQDGNAVTLTPSFNASKYSYEAKVPADAKLTFTPVMDEGAKFTVNGNELTDGSYTLDLSEVSWTDRKYTVTVKAENKAALSDEKTAAEYSIVFEQYPGSIAITKAPDKITYDFGESFDKTGMEVTATYTDGTETITADKLTFEPTEPLTTETKVTVKYENQTAEQAVTVASAFEGSGTEASPFLIKTADDLVKLAGYVAGGTDFDGKYLRMENDIELPAAWEPIGTYNVKTGSVESYTAKAPFSGTFDGNNKTLTVPEGGLPLFGGVQNATIKNLNIYGKKIAGYGLINNYLKKGNTTTVIENVTLKSGSQTLKAGFIGGYASGSDQIIIRNCKVEENVVIGYDKTQKWIGSFAGEFNGVIENCVSYATVYGTDFVGGIVADKGQSMGTFKVTNCEFYGNVTATGNYVGGIAGHGYGGTGYGFTAAAPCVTIENCFATGTIQGANYVGGILGGDAAVQYWDNGTGYIRNNHFAGKVSATASDAYAGGIIGYLKNINKNIIIENNYFISTCGAAAGIGDVLYVDTNNASHETASGATYIDSSQGAPSKLNPPVSGATKKDMNRTDDPLGADADKLTKSMTEAQFKDGTVTELLKLSDSSMHNWIQGTDYPVHSNEPIIYKLEVSDGYKKDYEIGDAFDLGTATITAYKSDNSTVALSAGDVTITGFDSTTRGQKTVTIAYGAVSAQVVVVVLQPAEEDDKITVSLRILGDTAHGAGDAVHTMASGNLTTWLSQSYTLDKNSTVEDLLIMADANNDSISISAEWNGQYGTSYINSVTYGGTTLAEFTNGGLSGWKYTVNGVYPEIGVSAYYLNNYDSVVFHYTDDYTKESDASNMGAAPEEEKNEVTTAGTGSAAVTTTPTEVTVSGSTATATVTKENVAETIKQATENKSAEIVLQVSANDTKGAANLKVQLDTAAVRDVVNKTEAVLTVKTENATVTLDRETLKTVAAEAAGSTVTLEVIEVTAPTAVQKEAAGANGHVIQLVIKSGDKIISLFNEGKATVTVEIPSKLTGKKVAAIHIADDGTTEHLKGSEVTVDGKKHYRFDTPHFSTFALVDADEIGLEVEEETMTAEEVKELLEDLSPVARSVKTAKKNVKVTLKLDAADKAIIEQLEDEGFTVKYNFYRSTKKTSKYSSKVVKEAANYTNTSGKKGTMYYYKARVQVYDADGKLVARTQLKQCKYANRLWTK